MEIKDFNELITFISDSYGVYSKEFGMKNPSTHFLTYIEDTLKKYVTLYDKPLYFLEKQRVKLLILKEMQNYKVNKAIATMPHGKLWKLFHPALWQKIKLIQNTKEELEEPEEVESKVLLPDIIHNRLPEPIDEEE